VQPREHQELVERVDNGPKDSGQVSIRHAHVGRSGALVGIAAISLAGNSKVARPSAQKEILAGPRLTPLFSIANPPPKPGLAGARAAADNNRRQASTAWHQQAGQ
jgi:hypothetical protein